VCYFNNFEVVGLKLETYYIIVVVATAAVVVVVVSIKNLVTWGHVHWLLGVKQLGLEANHYTSSPSYVFIAWCLIKHRLVAL